MPRHELHRLGRLLGRPGPRHRSRPAPGERRIPLFQLEHDAAAAAGAGEPRPRALLRRAGAEAGGHVNGRGLAVADYDNDGDLDVALNSIGGRLASSPRNIERRPLAPGEAAAVRAGHEGGRRPAGRQPARPRGARRQQLPLLRGSARPLRPRPGRHVSASSSRAIPAAARPGSRTCGPTGSSSPVGSGAWRPTRCWHRRRSSS